LGHLLGVICILNSFLSRESIIVNHTDEPVAADVEEGAVLGRDDLDGVDAELVVDDDHLLDLLHLYGAGVDVREVRVEDLQLPDIKKQFF
jgi:hypothetical protein